MTEAEVEQHYRRGYQEANTTAINLLMRLWDKPDPAIAWEIERRGVIAALRAACDDHGDNDWPDTLHLGDVIEKHLMRHVDEKWNCRK